MSTAMVPVSDLQQEATQWLVTAAETKIVDGHTQQIAADDLQANKAMQAKIASVFDPIISKAYAAHREACNQKRAIMEPLLESEAMLKRKIGDYLERIERERRAEEDRLRLLAEAEAAEQRERELMQAEALGATKQEITAMANEPMDRRPVYVQPAPKAQGISARDTWHAELTDIKAFIGYISRHLEYAGLLQANLPAIQAMARTLKNTMPQMPGIRVWRDTNITVKPR